MYNNLTNKKTINIHARKHSIAAHEHMQVKPLFSMQQVPDLSHSKQIITFYSLATEGCAGSTHGRGRVLK